MSYLKTYNEKMMPNGVINSDSLGNYTKPESGIPKSDLSEEVQETLESVPQKQETLVSGENIKTINNESILGEGNIAITAQTYVIDNTPAADSDNLVKSGGVAREIVWDVTARNSNATFASLSALLSDANLDTLIPTTIRRGGMQIRFVCSFDNKYMQFRYMPSDAATVATFTDVANWQGVDETPTAGSKNLVTSGGVANLFEGQYGTGAGDFSVSDEENNLIVLFGDGHIKTKNFNSKDVVDKLEELDNAIPYSISMFQSVACCGDSYVIGQIYKNGTLVGDRPSLSWGKNIERLCGVSVNIYASSGADTQTWQSRNDCLPAALSASPSGLYIFCLGINDASYVTLGTMADITSYESYEDYPNTFYGNYGKIIEQIEEHAPNSLIIIMTPCHPDYIAQFKTPIAEITNHYGIAMIDTSKSKLIMSPDYISRLSNGHPTAALYGALAMDIVKMVGDCIRDNYAYFKGYVGL